jgi:acyl-CoA reductase-like NAD-dependent aldehyde dehydrogenase
MSPAGDLARAVEAARLAGARAARRPRREIASALAAAAKRWRADATLRENLPAQAGLSAPVVAAGIDVAAEALDADAMVELVERELGSERPVRPWLVANVLASNVPGLALPAIALGCLAGAAVAVKSGRADRLSAAVFRRALEAEDEELAATVVATYWAGGDRLAEDAVLARADVVVATGADETVASLVRRFGARVVTHGERASIVVVGREALEDRDAPAERVARDVALHDQRGCLSPVAVYVEGDAGAFARRLAVALEALADVWPPGPLGPAERAAHRTAVAAAEWAGATVLDGVSSTVLLHPDPQLRPCPGRRTVWVHPFAALSDVLPTGRIECVAAAGTIVDLDVLRRRGVSRVCAPGRMQRPPLSWPRGQRAPLHAQLGLPAEPCLEVEPT